MNFLYISIIVSVFFLSANQVFSASYKDVRPSDNVYSNISDEYISEAKLLEGYIVRYKDNLYLRFDSLSLLEEKNAIWAFELLDLMELRVIQIQKGLIKNSDSKEVLKTIIYDLKKLNTAIKSYIKQEEDKRIALLKKRQSQYSLFSEKFSNEIDNFIGKITQVLIKKDSLSNDQKEMVRILVLMRKENEIIKNFKTQSFANEEDMKTYLRWSIINIRTHFQSLKNLSL